MNHAAWLLLLPLTLTVSGLLSGAAWLLWPTPGWPDLPLGNFATWSSMVCIAAFVLLRHPGRRLKPLGQLALALALAWGPCGRILSGNWRFTFSGGIDGTLWWQLSAALGGLLIFLVLWSLIAGGRATVRSAKISGS